MATEQIKAHLKRQLESDHNQQLVSQLKQAQWQKSSNYLKEREIDLSSNMLQSLHRRQFDLNSMDMNKQRQVAYRQVLDEQVELKPEHERSMQHRRHSSNRNESPVEEVMNNSP